MSEDDLREYIRQKMEEGIEVSADAFEGRPCSYCGETIDFAEVQRDPDAMVTWDIRVQDPGDDEPEPYVARHYFCSEECRRQAKRDEEWLSGEEQHGEHDEIHIDELEGMR